jgi:hypothetical protein
LTASPVVIFSLQFPGRRWGSIQWAEGEVLWSYGGCESLRNYPPIRDPLDRVTGPPPTCFSDLWSYFNGNVRRLSILRPRYLTREILQWTLVRPSTAIPTFGPRGQFLPSNNPGPRIYPSHAFDGSGGLWLSGGMRGGRNTFHSDVWLLRNGTWAWMGGAMPNETRMDNLVWNCKEGALHPFNAPAGRQQATMWFDPARNSLYLHGGNLFWEDLNATYVMSDLWSFSIPALQWAFVGGSFWPRATPSGIDLSDRGDWPRLAGHVALVDPNNSSKIVLFGGFGLVQNVSGISASTFEIQLSSRTNATDIVDCPNYSALWTTLPTIDTLRSKTVTIGVMGTN